VVDPPFGGSLPWSKDCGSLAREPVKTDLAVSTEHASNASHQHGALAHWIIGQSGQFPQRGALSAYQAQDLEKETTMSDDQYDKLIAESKRLSPSGSALLLVAWLSMRQKMDYETVMQHVGNIDELLARVERRCEALGWLGDDELPDIEKDNWEPSKD